VINLLLILLHVSVVRPSSSKNTLISMVTQLTTETYIHFDGGLFYLSTQRHYFRLILIFILLILLHVSVVRPSSSKNICKFRVTQSVLFPRRGLVSAGLLVRTSGGREKVSIRLFC
jgi:hypothetical protein